MVQDLQDLDARVSQIIASAWATNTLSVRNSQWKLYLRFCGERLLCALPAELSTIIRFLAYLESRNYKYSTINNYMSAVVTLHRFYGVQGDFRSTFLVQTVMAGLRNRLGHSSTPKLPLSVHQLKTMFGVYERSELNNVCWIAIMLCFRTLLRKSNVVRESNTDHVLLRGDVTFYPEYLTLSVRTSKTLKKGERPFVIPVYKCSVPGFCLWSLLRWHITYYPAPLDSPLLLKRMGFGVTPLLYTDVLKFLKDTVERIGLSRSDVGLHSLRRSGAMFLQEIGIPLHEIQMLGDWRSLAVLYYLSSTYERKLEIQKQVIRALLQ